MYTPELMKELEVILKQSNVFFGYSNVTTEDSDVKNETAFFNYDNEEIADDLRATAHGYKAFNA